jgi:hypothetical protein
VSKYHLVSALNLVPSSVGHSGDEDCCNLVTKHFGRGTPILYTLNAVTYHAVEPRTSKTQQRKAANKDYLQTRRDQAKLQKQIDQDLLRQALAFTFPSIPRIHICDPQYGPKHKPRVSPDERPKGERKRWSELESRILQDIPHNGTYQFVGIPNPNYTPGTHTPCWAALWFPSCVSVESQKELEEYVRKCKEVCIIACTSLLSLTCCS